MKCPGAALIKKAIPQRWRAKMRCVDSDAATNKSQSDLVPDESYRRARLIQCLGHAAH
jgi:hypothetical protein